MSNRCKARIELSILKSFYFRETLSGHSVNESKMWTPEQKKQWWDDRKKLDERLGDAVRTMQVSENFHLEAYRLLDNRTNSHVAAGHIWLLEMLVCA